jgi:hypothetical protein
MSEKSVTVKELDSMIESLFKGRKEIEEDEEKVSEKRVKLEALKAKIVITLKEHERESYKSDFGTVTVSEKWRVKLPDNDLAKKELIEHLRERGLFEKYVTVNSNSLNSLFMADWEAAKKNGLGMEFKMPGISDPSLFETLHITKGKGAKEL